MRNMCGIDAYRARSGRMNPLVAFNPGRWAGLRNHGPLARAASAKGASSLSPGQRPGCSRRNRPRPVGPRFERCHAPAHRAPLGRMNLLVALNPARWAGLRNHGPLARAASAKGASSLSPGQRPGYSRRNRPQPIGPRFERCNASASACEIAQREGALNLRAKGQRQSRAAGGVGLSFRPAPTPRLSRGVVVDQGFIHNRIMFTRIQTRSFRCLRSVNQTLGPFRALVGPNASGKTTFLVIIHLPRSGAACHAQPNCIEHA